MQSIYDAETLQDILGRLNKLTPETQRKWGTMDVAQMMAHCCEPLAVALGEKTMKVPFMMKVLAPLFIKSTVIGEKPFKENLPTAPQYKIADAKDFNREKTRLISLVTRASQEGPEIMNARKHPFFGSITAQDWSNANVKHLDHHLRQFGV